MRVLVTGSASHLAAVLLPRLCAAPQVERVHGVDLRPSGFAHARYSETRLDVRDRALGGLLGEVDAIVHLAFVVIPAGLGRRRFDRTWIRDVNLGGTRNVATLARRAGVQRLVHLSSAVVYGAWPDNPPRLSEAAPRRAMPGFAYSEDKVAVEDWLDAFEAQAPRPLVIRLRPHVILGPRAQPLLRALLRMPVRPRLPDPQPLSQCVHEADVADAVLAALLHAPGGAYNLAAEPALSFRDMLAVLHRHSLGLPHGLLQAVHRTAWRFTGAGGEPAWLEAMRYPLAVDSSRARRELQWRPRDTRACLQGLREADPAGAARERTG